MNNAQTVVRHGSQPARPASSARALGFSRDTAFQLALRRRVTEHFWATGRRRTRLLADVREDGDPAHRIRGDIRVAGVPGPDLDRGRAPGRPARAARGRDRPQHPARWWASRLLEPPLGQPAHGIEPGADRRELLPLALEARGVPSHVRQRREPRHRHRSRPPCAAGAEPEAARHSSLAAPVHVAALRAPVDQVAVPGRLSQDHPGAHQLPPRPSAQGLGARDLRRGQGRLLHARLRDPAAVPPPVGRSRLLRPQRDSSRGSC